MVGHPMVCSFSTPYFVSSGTLYHVFNEPQKAGVDEHDLPALAEAVLALPRLEVRGLMCLPPFFDDGEAARFSLKNLQKSI